MLEKINTEATSYAACVQLSFSWGGGNNETQLVIVFVVRSSSSSSPLVSVIVAQPSLFARVARWEHSSSSIVCDSVSVFASTQHSEPWLSHRQRVVTERPAQVERKAVEQQEMVAC